MRIIICLVLVLFTGSVFAEQVATKISEDTVKLETIYYTKTAKPVVISQQEFKRLHIEERLQAFTELVDYWNIIDMEIYRAKQLEEPIREKERYTKLKEAVDGEIDDTVIVKEYK